MKYFTAKNALIALVFTIAVVFIGSVVHQKAWAYNTPNFSAEYGGLYEASDWTDVGYGTDYSDYSDFSYVDETDELPPI